MNQDKKNDIQKLTQNYDLDGDEEVFTHCSTGEIIDFLDALDNATDDGWDDSWSEHAPECPADYPDGIVYWSGDQVIGVGPIVTDTNLTAEEWQKIYDTEPDYCKVDDRFHGDLDGDCYTFDALDAGSKLNNVGDESLCKKG